KQALANDGLTDGKVVLAGPPLVVGLAAVVRVRPLASADDHFPATDPAEQKRREQVGRGATRDCTSLRLAVFCPRPVCRNGAESILHGVPQTLVDDPAILEVAADDFGVIALPVPTGVRPRDLAPLFGLVLPAPRVALVVEDRPDGRVLPPLAAVP